jgi:hypothetical protein
VAVACATTLVLVACGGDGDETAAPTSTTSATATSSASPPAPPSASGTGDQPPAGDDVPAPGTTFPGEGLSADHAADLQEEVDEGHEPWRLDQSSVAAAFARDRFGWADVDVALDDPHTVQVTDATGQHVVSLQMRQPAREGDTGIWVVDSGVWLG